MNRKITTLLMIGAITLVAGQSFLNERNLAAAASKPTTAPAEPAKPTTAPAKPTAAPAKPTVEPAKPTTEPAKPAESWTSAAKNSSTKAAAIEPLAPFKETNKTTSIPKFYGDNFTISYAADLGCGGCIEGGYVYCIPGAAGSEPSTWGKNTAFCCKNTTSCPDLKNKTYLCSSTYKNKTLAKAMCPFKNNSCGSHSALNLTKVGDKLNLSISLKEGETCTFKVTAACGLPTFLPNDTTGFHIE
jgi:hypothetical protein